MRIKLKKQKVKIEKLSPGTMFRHGDTLALKSEYHNDNGVCLCYIVGTGEVFWGGVSNPNKLRVQPFDITLKSY